MLESMPFKFLQTANLHIADYVLRGSNTIVCHWPTENVGHI